MQLSKMMLLTFFDAKNILRHNARFPNTGLKLNLLPSNPLLFNGESNDLTFSGSASTTTTSTDFPLNLFLPLLEPLLTEEQHEEDDSKFGDQGIARWRLLQ